MANLRTNNLSGEQGQNAYRGSVFFDGVDNSNLAITSNSDFTFGTGVFTAECWIRVGAYPASNVYGIFDTGTSVNANRFSMVMYPTGKIYIDNNSNLIISDTILSTDSWHHLAFVREGTGSNESKLYINGVLDKSATISSDFTNDDILIGKTIDNYEFKGYISNARITKGEAVYTANFTPSTSELTADANTVLLCCQDSNDPTQEETGKTITASGSLATAGYLETQPKVIPPYGVDAGNTFGGPIQQSTQGYMYFPTGRTEERGRGRGIIAGGSPGTDNNEQIEFFDIQSDGVVTEFGELASARRGCSGCSSSTRGLVATGTATNPSPSFTNSIEFITITTTSNATDYGDLNYASRNVGGLSNQTRGLFAGGGDNPTFTDNISLVTIASIGDASDFGNLTAQSKGRCGVSSPTRGLFAGGIVPSVIRTIDKIEIATTANATDFGDLTGDVFFCGGVSSPTRGVYGGGSEPSKTNIIQFVTIASAGDATDFGDLTDQRDPDNSQICSHTRGLFVGGENPGPSACKLVDKITIATTGNATNFGDIRTSTSQSAGGSDSHGGLS